MLLVGYRIVLQLFLNLFARLLLIDRLHHTDNTTTNKDENNVIDILLKVKNSKQCNVKQLHVGILFNNNLSVVFGSLKNSFAPSFNVEILSKLSAGF